jgi:membrane-associated protease RseP (regulator of RpoE activity)
LAVLQNKAGLRPGDRIVAIGGQKLETLRPFYEAIVIGHSDVVELTVEDPYAPGRLRQLQLVVHSGRPVPPRTMRLEDLLGLPIDYSHWGS